MSSPSSGRGEGFDMANVAALIAMRGGKCGVAERWYTFESDSARGGQLAAPRPLTEVQLEKERSVNAMLMIPALLLPVLGCHRGGHVTLVQDPTAGVCVSHQPQPLSESMGCAYHIRRDGTLHIKELDGCDVLQADNVERLLPSLVSIVASTGEMCAQSRSGDVYCWGTSSEWQIGGSEFQCRWHGPTPTLVLRGVVSLQVYHGVFCAMKHDSSLFCWGTPHREMPYAASRATGAYVCTPSRLQLDLEQNRCATISTGPILCIAQDGYEVDCWVPKTNQRPTWVRRKGLSAATAYEAVVETAGQTCAVGTWDGLRRLRCCASGSGACSDATITGALSDIVFTSKRAIALTSDEPVELQWRPSGNYMSMESSVHVERLSTAVRMSRSCVLDRLDDLYCSVRP